MTQTTWLARLPVEMRVEKDSFAEQNLVKLGFDKGDFAFYLMLDEKQLLSLYYKIRYFVENNIHQKHEKSESEELCITMRVPKESSKSTISEMRKFLHSMTATDVGLFAKLPKETNLFQDTGDTSTVTSTSLQKNG